MNEYDEYHNINKKKLDLKDNDEISNQDFSQTEEWIIDEDVFNDENIEETLRRYNYDYKSFMRDLTTFVDYSELISILNECGIKKEAYLNPTYVTFEKVREKIINKRKTI